MQLSAIPVLPVFRAVRIVTDYTIEIILKAGLGVMVCMLTVQAGIIPTIIQDRASSLIGFFPFLPVGFIVFLSLRFQLCLSFFLFKLLPEIFRDAVGYPGIR